jgi:Uncharacterized conserved protein
MSKRISNFFINLAVTLNIFLGIGNLLFTPYHRFQFLHRIKNYYSFFTPEDLVIHRTLSIVVGFGLLFISYRLYKRMRTAWIISICLLVASVIMHLFVHSMISKHIAFVELLAILILLISYKEFNRETNPLSIRNSLIMAIVVGIIILLNTAFTVYVLKIRANLENMEEAVKSTIHMLFMIEPNLLGSLSRREMLFVKSSIVINWMGIIVMLVFLLKPLIYQPIITAKDREKVRKLLHQYADNPISYVSVESDKQYYFGKNVEGVIVYVITAGVAVCAGDPISKVEDMPLLLAEFINYCKENELNICFCQTMEQNLPLYSQLGFGSIKYGEEAMFDLDTYKLTGRNTAKIRQAINHIAEYNITVSEYKYLEKRDKVIESQIHHISNEWLENKKSSELSFMLGSISLENPMDRRYFAAYDNDNNMLGFIVFVPFAGGKGYYADVTRRKKDAPIGVMEKITIEAFARMKEEGVKWGSLGLAPLANVAADGKTAGKLLEFVYENLNNFYGFKSLHQYKKKYGPSAWESRYLVFYPKIFTPKIAYSVIKAQNPKGVSDFIFTQLKSIFKNSN